MAAMRRHSFAIGEHDFLLDGEPHRVISGALHYFRIHPDQWRDRIRMGRMMGLNTIETYVAWNEHSPEPGVFDTIGRLDLARFLREVQEEGLHAIVRPGPYICAEFDGGGFPAWLFRDPEVGVRTLEPRYMAAVTDYLRAVMDIVAPLQIDRGGPVILLQVENEYGAYGSDHAYLQALTDLFRETGATVPLDGLAAASALPSAPLAAGANVFQATVTLPASADLALSTEGLGKGLVWVNGFCLGRYWRAGPQHTLFVPGPATRVGENLVTVLELEALTADALRFVPDLDLGHTDS